MVAARPGQFQLYRSREAGGGPFPALVGALHALAGRVPLPILGGQVVELLFDAEVER
jgi:hypothetical protein